MFYIDIAGPAPHTLGMKITYQNGERADNTNNNDNTNHNHAEYAKTGVTPHAAFGTLLSYFRYECGRNKILKKAPKDAVENLARQVFCAAVGGFGQDFETPPEFGRIRKALDEAMQRARADAFITEFERRCTVVLNEEDGRFISEVLRMRDEMEACG